MVMSLGVGGSVWQRVYEDAVVAQFLRFSWSGRLRRVDSTRWDEFI